MTRRVSLMAQWWHCLTHLHRSITLYAACNFGRPRVIERRCECGWPDAPKETT